MDEIKQRTIAEFQAVGEKVVRDRIADGTYNRLKRSIAEEWLLSQSRLRNEDSMPEQSRTTRSAKNAAWAAAIAAIVAAIATTVMAVIAYQSLPS